jgi:hypothetical protein
MKLRPLQISIASLFLAATAVAQTNPTFVYAKPDEPKPAAATTPPPPPPPPPKVEWKAQVKGGFLATSGNSQTTGGTFAGNVSRKEGNNRLTFDAGAAYGRSNVLTPVITTMTDPTTMVTTSAITNTTRTEVVSTNNWFTKGRYDRFFTTNNSGYVSAQAAADPIAGKSFFGGGQIGYSRQVYKSAMHLAVAELGYDFSYQRYVQSSSTPIDPVSIHSARLFVGERLTLSPETGINASVEALFNLNTETNALVASPSTPGEKGVDPFHDTRLTGKLGLTTTLRKRLSIAFGFTVKYEQNPAPLPIPSGTAPNIGFTPGFQPFAQTVDTATEATLIYTFL